MQGLKVHPVVSPLSCVDNLVDVASDDYLLDGTTEHLQYDVPIEETDVEYLLTKEKYYFLAEPQSEELVSPDVARFYPADSKLRKEIEHFPSFATDPIRYAIGPLNEDFKVRPVFEIENGKFSAKINIEEGACFYGTGETPGSLLLNGRKIVTWPTDNGNYNENSDRCYQAHPYVLVLRKDGSAFGVIFDTSCMVSMNLKDGLSAICDTPFSVIVIDKKTPQEVVMALSDLTGKMPLPPKWSIGYHQCRYSYYPQEKAMKIAKQFRNKNIPADVIWFDIHYMHGYRIFTFDHDTFPTPEKINSDLHDMGFHTVWMIDPGVKKEKGYFVHDQLVQHDMAVKTANGDNYVGDVWPGPCVFPDFTMEETREWWGGLYKDFLAKGVDGVWNDMNEPAVFHTPTQTMPLTNIHRGFGGGTHDRFHNVYGMLMARASVEGMKKANPEKRPFLLSRANYLGGQKYAATWTGDNHSNWKHLGMSIPMVLNLGLSGQPFSGPDLGGFSGNANPKLYARWIGFGALLPFARAHSDCNSLPHEPWSFGKKAEEICRVAISRRYMLLPYFYTLFYISSTTGLPVVQPLFFVDPVDPKLRTEDRAFMLGEHVAVIVNIYENNKKASPVVLPSNAKWYTLKLDEYNSTELPELKIRAGGIIPAQSVIQHSSQDPEYVSLFIALDDNKQAKGISYNDSGDGYEYKDGYYILTTYEASLHENIFSLKIKEEGRNPRLKNTPLKIHVILDADQIITHTIENTDYKDTIQFPISEFTAQ